MKVTGVSMVRDEADVVAGTLRHMAQEVDDLIVADNLSTDGTRDILNQLARELPLTVIDDPDPAHYQSRKMTALAELAASRGATWIVPFDADELWGSPHGRLGDLLSRSSGDLVVANIIDHVCTSIDDNHPDPFVRMAWRKGDLCPLVKVAFRWQEGVHINEGNHGITKFNRLEGQHTETLIDYDTPIYIRHFPYRSLEQFKKKVRNGARSLGLTNLPDEVGIHWRGYGRLLDRYGPSALAQAYHLHHVALVPWESGLILDPAPYHQDDAR